MKGQISKEHLDATTVRLADRRTSFGELFEAWASDKERALAFSQLLAGMPGRAFRWELPPLDHQRLDQPFECVVVDSPCLEIQPIG